MGDSGLAGAREYFRHNKKTLPQDAQKVRPARPQAEKEPEANPRGYGEDSCEPRTPLEDFLSILR
jgi:hypothetical protein